MLSLRELERAAAILRREIVGHRVQQVVQPDATSVALELYGASGGEAAAAALRRCDPERARVGIAREAPAARGRRRASRSTCARTCAARACRRGAAGRRARARAARARRGRLDAPARDLRPQEQPRRARRRGPDRAGAAPARGDAARARAGRPWQQPGRTLPRAGEDRFAAVSDADYLAAIEAHYAERTREVGAEALRRRVAGALRKEVKSLERKLEKVARELASARRPRSSSGRASCSRARRGA